MLLLRGVLSSLVQQGWQAGLTQLLLSPPLCDVHPGKEGRVLPRWTHTILLPLDADDRPVHYRPDTSRKLGVSEARDSKELRFRADIFILPILLLPLSLPFPFGLDPQRAISRGSLSVAPSDPHPRKESSI